MGGADSEHDPVGLDVRDVVEHQAADCHRSQVHQSGWLGDVAQARVLWMERERDEGLEAARFILQFTQSNQMVDSVQRFFDVAVEHRAVGLDAKAMRGAVDVQPVAAIRFVFADLVADFGVENFSAAAGEATQARIDQLLQHPLRRLLGKEFKPVQLNGRPAFKVERWEVVVQ